MTTERPSLLGWLRKSSDPLITFYASVPEPKAVPPPPPPPAAPADIMPGDGALADAPPAPFSDPRLGPDRQLILKPPEPQDERVMAFYRALTDRKGEGKTKYGTKKLEELEAPGSTLVRIAFDPKHEKVAGMGLEWIARSILTDLLSATEIVLGVADYVGALVPRQEPEEPLQIVITQRDQARDPQATAPLRENRNL